MIIFHYLCKHRNQCLFVLTEKIKRICFHRKMLLIVGISECFVNMLLTFIVIFAALTISNFSVNFIAFLYLSVIIVVPYLLRVGITLLSVAFTFYFKDIVHILRIMTMAWQLLTPVIYDISIIPENVLPTFHSTHMTSVILAYRKILYYSRFLN